MPPHDSVHVHQYVSAIDDLADDDNLAACNAWTRNVLAEKSLRALEAFVADAMHATATYVENMRGSYNLVLKFRVGKQAGAVDDNTTFSSKQHVVLRLPRHGYYPPVLVAEMLETEVAWMHYFVAHGIAKVPTIFAWSSTSDNGINSPFMLTEFIDGAILNGCLELWFKSTDPQDKTRLHAAYEDLAAMQLAIYRHRFDKIGGLCESDDGRWEIARRPVTHTMRDILLNVPGTTTDAWPRGPLSTAAEYKALFLQLYRTQQDTLRSINTPGHWTRDGSDLLWEPNEGEDIDMDLARAKAAGRIVARHGFAHPDCLAHLNDRDTGPFRIFNVDIHPRNMIVNPDTGRIVAIFDLEGTNALPAAFAEDPPLFLRPFMLFHIIALGKLKDWEKTYAPLLDTYLDTMQRLEARQPPTDAAEDNGRTPLSASMRASWESKRWLEHFAMSNLNLSDYVFWSHLYSKMKPILDAKQDDLDQEIKAYQLHTERQIAAYEKDRIARKSR
ncbi:Protein kinase-like domain protein [Niveomyces insectorum RCEF 264]|uniref:Protein kinase-like domain protein n=1 Tax=Niveomyces insectorum RCEF 264 TaxID=1081102 RepID=A0A167X5X1_9HYPO|nr:Protein kinase-like domain protein [Niveomyces insectorum RCEF 264]